MLLIPPISTLFPYTTLFRSLGEDNTLMTFENGRALRTPFFDELLTEIKAFCAELVIEDTLADVFGGNEIDRGQSRRFVRSEEHTSELQSHHDLVCRLLLEKK